MKRAIRRFSMFASMLVTFVWVTVPAYAAGGITNPLTGNNGNISSIMNSVISWILGAIAAVAGSWFLFHFYKAVMAWMAGSHHAQKREEAKSHFVHVVISGVLLGAAGVVASALYNFGSSLH